MQVKDNREKNEAHGERNEAEIDRLESMILIADEAEMALDGSIRRITEFEKRRDGRVKRRLDMVE